MIPKDKKLHIIVGFAIGFAVAIASTMSAAGIVASAVAAWSKELWDRRTPGHTYDPWDAHATVLGGVIGSTLGALVWLLYKSVVT